MGFHMILNQRRGPAKTTIRPRPAPGGESILACHSAYKPQTADGRQVLQSKIVSPTLGRGRW